MPYLCTYSTNLTEVGRNIRIPSIDGVRKSSHKQDDSSKGSWVKVGNLPVVLVLDLHVSNNTYNEEKQHLG